MKKFLLSSLALSMLVLAGCLHSGDATPEATSTGSVSETSSPSAEAPQVEVLAWHFLDRLDDTVQTGDVLRVIKNFDDLDVQETSYSFMHDAGVVSQIAGAGYEVRVQTTSGVSTLEVTHDGETLSYAGEADNTMGDVLGVNMHVAGVYGPFDHVFASGTYALYTLLSPYGGSLEQRVLDLVALKEVGFAEYFLYHNKNNTKVFATMLEQPGAMTMYKDLVVFADNTRTVLLSGGIDGFSYDGYYLYAYRLDQTGTSTLWVIDSSDGSLVHTLQNIGIGHEGKFILQSNVLYASYGMVDFVREETFQQLMAYDISQQQSLWEIQLD